MKYTEIFARTEKFVIKKPIVDVFNIAKKEYYSHYEKLARQPEIFYMNIETYKNMVRSSNFHLYRPAIDGMGNRTLFGCEIKINNYLEDGIVIPTMAI